MQIKNVTLFTQHLGEKCLKKFADLITKMRIQATYDGDETKQNTSKILGNACYGKMMENPLHHGTTKLVRETKLGKYMRKKTFRTFNQLETEEDAIDLVECSMAKSRIVDSYPIQIGNAILQHSKLHFLR